MRVIVWLSVAVQGKGAVAVSELDDIGHVAHSYGPRLLRFVAMTLQDEDAAATIVQDSLLKAYTTRDSFRNDCSLSSWLFAIAINLIRDHQRVKKYQFWRNVSKTALDVVEKASVLPSQAQSPEEAFLAKERGRAIGQVVDTLSERQRMIFLLRFSEEMEVREIAEATNLPVNTVKTHLHRAIKAVQQRMGVPNR